MRCIAREHWLSLAIILVQTVTLWAGTKSPVPVRVWEDSMVIPTSEEGVPDENPPFDSFNTGRFYNYPYTLRHNLIDRRTPRKWRTLNLENEYLKCTILPDLGGHLYNCVDKINGASMFYANPSIKFARIAYRGMWAALGIEFNFPVSHNWMTVSPVDFATFRDRDGSASVWVGNIDRPYGMQWRVQLTLRPGRAYLEQRTTLYNKSDTRHRFYWWTNAGVQVWDDSRILYPMEFTAAHGFADIDTWPVNAAGVDQSVVANHKYGPVSRFSYGSREPYMAVYHPHTHAGVVHYSSPLDLPAKKIWSWGSDPDGLKWRTALSDNDSAYVEIQAGLFRDQETYGFLEPQESRTFSEYWLPIRDLGGVSKANPNAVLNLSRRASSNDGVDLDVVFNVSRELQNGVVTVLNGKKIVASARASLSPSETFHKVFPGLPSGVTYTVELRNDSDLILSHTENQYDFVPRDQVHVGKQPSHTYPAEANFGADDFARLGNEQESNGELPTALETYSKGLARFTESITLNKAAGRLETALAQYENGMHHLSKALVWQSDDHETAYYLGLSEVAEDDIRAARTHFEFAQQSERYRAPALMALCAIEARAGNRERALSLIQDVLQNAPALTQAGKMEVALLRSVGRSTDAKSRIVYWRNIDPTDSLLRYESTKAGSSDPGLLPHLAGDPQRILEIAAEYMNLGMYSDAVAVLSAPFPQGPEVVSEPGMVAPQSYPLVAYYRGYCLYLLGQDGRKDFDAASLMSTKYVFPNRPESLPVLKRAIDVNPQDATSHFLLGELYLASGEIGLALDEWEKTRQLKPSTPTLHRNMGYAVLRSGQSPQKAIELFRDGTKYDIHNVDVYLGLEQAMDKAGQPASERAQALESYPELSKAPAALIFRLVQVLSDAEQFEAAEKLLEGRFFPREEGGASGGEIYTRVRLKHAALLASKHDCSTATDIVDRLQAPASTVPGTPEKIAQYTTTEKAKQTITQVQNACR